MEIAGADGSILEIDPGETRELGRGHGLNSSDKTISRRQVSFFVPQNFLDRKGRVQFEVLGRNPIYVSRNNEVKIFRRFERGEMENGDMFCVSAKDPVWYTLRGIVNCGPSVRRNDAENDLAGDLDTGGVDDFNQGDVDMSDIDPVTEFGFLVIGHEFDLYPKKMIRDIKNLDWFLDEAREDSEDDDNEGKKGKRGGRKKRKKGAENDDDDWTGESEDDNVLVNKPRNAQTPKYVTRSKDRGKPGKATTKKSSVGQKTQEVDDEDVDEDEDDVTLGGFIVDDENLDEEEEEEKEEEEEEEFLDEDDE